MSRGRFLFAAGSLETVRPLILGSLKMGDSILSDAGLKAKIVDCGFAHVVAEVIDGMAFSQKHSKEIHFNRSLKRYEIYANHITKWRREERSDQPSGDTI